MVAILSLLLVLTLSILVTRIATIALTLTGLSRQTARFQSRSAFTGVGFTTHEAERVVNHPVRRKVLMILMLLGNAGIVTVVSSLILTFVKSTGTTDLTLRLLMLIAGLALLWTAAQSRWLDRRLSPVLERILSRWADLEVRDYVSLLDLGGDYRIHELQVQPDDWLANRSLRRLKLQEEGVLVLGIQGPDGVFRGAPHADTKLSAGDTVIIYGRSRSLQELDQRKAGVGGGLAHSDAVLEQRRIAKQEEEEEALQT